ncbi:MAG TPA: hypothetical protein VGQ46_19130 [Thermoanaerobaculia bacterium]|jgi:hypothetical protein|nr:hypothetical protein [Thermoanaerobaculia bacterium]
MKPSTRSSLQLTFAAIQALGAVFAIAALFGFTPASLLPSVVWLILAATVCGGVAFTLNSQNPIGVAALSRSIRESGSHSEPDDRWTLSASQSWRIHRLVPLTICSIVASIVIVPMSSDITAACLVGLAPLWVGGVSFASAKVVASHKHSAVAIGSLVCGFLGAFVGSNGNAATELGFIWYCLAGGLMTGYFVTTDERMSIAAATIGTALFIGSTAVIADFVVSHFLKNLSSFIRRGFPVFILEMDLIVLGYLLALSFVKRRQVAQLSDETPAEIGHQPGD